MGDEKPVSTPLASHIKLTKRMWPSTMEGRDNMTAVPYSSTVGSLMHTMVCNRSDIVYTVGVVSRYLSNPGREHWEVVKWIFRYLKATSSLCLGFGGLNPVLEDFTDVDIASSKEKKSTSGYLFTFARRAVSW